MNGVIVNELSNWINVIKKKELNRYDITMVNIILKNLDSIKKVGIHQGGRGKLLAKIIGDKKQILDEEIVDYNFKGMNTDVHLTRLNSLNVEYFRGFQVNQEFDFTKQYTFIYGPNGSGKSSLCEAIEFGMLNNIEEAETRNIKQDKYVKNSFKNKIGGPNIIATYSDGSTSKVIADYEKYKFSFIEKNRIDKFSHIDAATPKSQGERIAALFGLTVFNEFVNGFTSDLINKYLVIEPVIQNEFNNSNIIYNADKESKKENKLELEKLAKIEECNIDKIRQIANNKIENYTQALAFLNDSKNGKITKLILEKEENKIKEINVELLLDIKDLTLKLKNSIQNIRKDKNKLASNAMDDSFLNLYKIINTLERKEECPACHTPLNKVSVNPYDNAKEGIVKLKSIQALKNNINKNVGYAFEYYKSLNKYLTETPKVLNLLKLKSGITHSLLEKNDFVELNDNTFEIEKVASEISELSTEELKIQIDALNEEAKELNTRYDEKIKKLSLIRDELVASHTTINNLRSKQKELGIKIEKFEENNQRTLEKIEEEKCKIEFYKRMNESYKKIRESLIAYNNQLPINLARNLSEKIKTYYNIMNKDDVEFEKISNIYLPKEIKEKIIIEFKDGKKVDALEILSEGHVKLLGLAILLAKAKNDNNKFLIFDDIVNAIDDDHRDGIAELIMKYEHFKDIQIILTCHGEEFITKLQNKLSQSEGAKRIKLYKFLPLDIVNDRGILVKASDSKVPLDCAEKNLAENELRDALSKCRQASECILNSLWKKLSKKLTVPIGIEIEFPSGNPSLHDIACGIKSKIKKDEKLKNIYKYLEMLIESDKWNLLNKGTHFEIEQKEFERGDVKRMVNLLKTLDNEVRTLRIKK